MSYFHLGPDAEVEMEVTHHAVALTDYDCERFSAKGIESNAAMALAFDEDACFRVFDGVLWVHWTTERPVAA